MSVAMSAELRSMADLIEARGWTPTLVSHGRGTPPIVYLDSSAFADSSAGRVVAIVGSHQSHLIARMEIGGAWIATVLTRREASALLVTAARVDDPDGWVV